MKNPIILGGGLAGLSAAYHSNGIIYEKLLNKGDYIFKFSAKIMNIFILE